MRSDTTDPADLLAFAVGMAEQASDLLLDGLDRSDLEVDTKSSPTDLVTEVDRSTEAHIVDRITTSRPHDGILGEEGTAVEGTSGVRWVIDPIDGTTNYFYGFPGFAVSIAAERDGEPLIGVVASPLTLDVFTAIAGQGAWRNGDPISVTDTDDLSQALVATGFSYDPVRRRSQAETVAAMIGEVRDIRRTGSAALDLCSVGAGRVDAYYESGTQHWDWAAGALVAREAGARVEDLGGGTLGSGTMLAAAPSIWASLAELLTSAGA